MSYFIGKVDSIAAKNQRSVFDKSNVSPEQLENFVGKDVAKKLLESKPDNVGARKLFGEDLQVGGEGMKGFYDNILPKSLDKLGKKFGAKVGKTEMDGVRGLADGHYSANAGISNH
jgi:hypothetical protein